MFSYSVASLPRLDGKLAVVTGANSGLGLQTSRAFAQLGARVILACRSPEKAQAALDDLRRRVPGADVEALALDLASLTSVRAAAASLHEGPRIDILVNNGGVMALPHRKTADGFEMQLGTNHLGHFALTGGVYDHFAERARVVTISSTMHRAGRMRWDDLDGERGFETWQWYGQSKLANLLFTFGLNRRLRARGSSVAAVAAHPGYAATNLQHAGPTMEGSRWKAAMMTVGNTLFAQSDERGAWPQIHASVATEVEGGQYWGPAVVETWGAPRLSSVSASARNEADQDRLWAVSQERTGVVFGG